MLALIIGLYIVVGVIHTIKRLGNPDPMKKPEWMLAPPSFVTWVGMAIIYTLLWPISINAK